jgi:hypothetical protein
VEIKIGPPPVPNRDKFPFVGTANFQGIKINIENMAGSTREGKDANGEKWSTKMRYHYGEIVRGEGTDGDKLDVYLGPNQYSKQVFIVHQNHPKDHPTGAGTYDEDKVILGANTADEAKRIYMRQYDDPSFFRSITHMRIDKFKKAMIEDRGEKIAAIKRAAEACQKRRKRNPSAFIRMKLREGGTKEAYWVGVELALKEAELAGMNLLKNTVKVDALKKPPTTATGAPPTIASGSFSGKSPGGSSGSVTTGTVYA